jgi:lysine N-acyltransferase
VEAWEYDWPPERWQRYLRAQLDGEYSRPFISTFRGGDFGYVELYRAAKDSIAPRYAADPYDVGLHGAIADLTFINRGIGPTVLSRIVASVFELEPRCTRIMFDPDHRNSGARRLCEYAGCEFLGEHDMSNRRMALYALPRSCHRLNSRNGPSQSRPGAGRRRSTPVRGPARW